MSRTRRTTDRVPEGRGVPAPPEHVDPLTTTWKAGTLLYRVHRAHYLPHAFNQPPRGRRGRFHPIRDASGRWVPTLYAADCIDGALSETTLHNVVAGGAILRSRLQGRCLTRIELTRDILVADLRGHGLRRLGLTRARLLDCGAPHYAETARWAEAIHRSSDSLHGMVWVSRQFDTAAALLAFGDRLHEHDFRCGATQPLDGGRGYRLVQDAAAAAGITVVEA